MRDHVGRDWIALSLGQERSHELRQTASDAWGCKISSLPVAKTGPGSALTRRSKQARRSVSRLAALGNDHQAIPSANCPAVQGLGPMEWGSGRILGRRIVTGLWGYLARCMGLQYAIFRSKRRLDLWPTWKCCARRTQLQFPLVSTKGGSWWAFCVFALSCMTCICR